MPYMQLARSRPAPKSPLLRLIGMGSIAWGTRAGMGDTCYDELGDAFDCDTGTITSTPPPAPTPVTTPLMTGPTPTPGQLNQPIYPVSTSTPSSSGFNLANLFSSITNAAIAGQKIYLTAQGPSLVPGTNAIYNPATGQYYNPTTGQVVNAPGVVGGSSTLFPAGLSTANLGPILLFGGLALGAVFLISAVGKH
jgi:hypothetical protein